MTTAKASGWLIVALLAILALVIFNSCKTVHKSSSETKTTIDSTAHSSVTVTKIDTATAHVITAKIDTGSIAIISLQDVLSTTVTKYDSLGRKTEKVTTTHRTAQTAKKEQKNVHEEKQEDYTWNSNFDSTAAAEVAYHVEKEEKHTELERKPAARGYLIWLIVFALGAGAIYFCIWRFKKEKDTIANNIHS